MTRLITRCRTLGEMYQESAATWPDKRIEFRGTDDSLTYAELVSRSRQVAAGLQERGIEPGSLVGLIHGNDPGFLLSFFAISLAGAVPTPLPLPGSASGITAFLTRIRTIVNDAGIRWIIVSPALSEHLQRLGGRLEGLLAEVTPLDCGELEGAGGSFSPPRVSADDLALVQYTSGSTSDPKGVALRHRHVVASIDAIGHGIDPGPSDVNGQWLPLFHDMGLIGTLTGIAHGTSHHLWQPSTFIRRPGRWLREYAEVGGSIYAGPNFSYAYLLQNVTPAEVAELDLSRWRVAFNGAESIDPRLMEAFIDRFAPAGFRPSTMFPVYGLAEATLAVTFPRLGDPPFALSVDRRGLTDRGEVIERPPGHPAARRVVCVGAPIKGMEVRVVSTEPDAGPSANPKAEHDAETDAATGRHVLPQGRVGEIEIRGAAVMDGYYGRTALAGSAGNDGGWLRTGDLGFFREGQLFVTGRIKQLLIVRGHNYYPEDIEFEVRTVDGVYKGRNVAVVGTDELGETVSVVAETTVQAADDLSDLASAIVRGVKEKLGIPLGDVVLVCKRSLRRTTNGKYQRVLMGQLLRQGQLDGDILFRLGSGGASTPGV